MVCLTNRFHVAVRLFCIRSQMMSKCGKNKQNGTWGDIRLLPRLCPLWRRRKNAIDVAFYLYKMKHLITMRGKELWLVEKNHATVKPDSSVAPRGMTTKAELWRKCWTNQINFFHRRRPVSRRAWTLHKNCRSWKNTLGKLVVAVNQEAIWLEFWMKGALVTVGIFDFL